ncbi:hypothetical protein PM082_024415 [Marasmius tenuissimus]|nr:hypothetical protein PM082_024415 [Marasmius tenuissimus]
MQFTTLFVTIAACATATSAANIQGRQLIPHQLKGLKVGNILFISPKPEIASRAFPSSFSNISEPNDLRNCPGSGIADACNLERPCNRIRVNYGSPVKGHYVWYNYNINDIPDGVNVGTEASCSDY